MKKTIVISGVLVLALALLAIARDGAPAYADTVHSHTNVTIVPGCWLVPEGTPGAPLIASTGAIGLGRGGYGVWPYDDGWTSGQFMPTAADHANYFDRNWLQIYGTATFDLGASFDKVYIALSQDHGPYPQEAIDYRLAVSNDNVSYMDLPWDTPITMFRRGWSAAGETTPCVGPFTGDHPVQPGGSGRWADVSNDDYSVLWELPGSYRYVRVIPISDIPPYEDPEIDAVMGVEFGTWTIGYWKNHADVAEGLLPITLGDDDTNGVCETINDAADVVAIMDAAKSKDAADMLRAQLLAAKLNVRMGHISAADLAAIALVIADADELLGRNACNPDTGKQGVDRAEAVALIEALDAFNNMYSS